ncbi:MULTISPECIES: hypothetical protein [unclassified Streptomyces]|uniref:hypothetical protein n=1 Tax=unclassified Streptomyces TaxID=2593676 RepID=UPI000823E47C|nr:MULTISPECIES: hypothetical protein [unclassified Streptomyces]MYT96627.1 hypothetical protein [Streptomyces sp. SID8350]SCK54315.1 hypothetical protein YUWDRAFT_04832 [Streptomyces sp. AmelKG-D3]
MTLADEHEVDLLIYHRDGTIYVDSRTGAPEHLLGLLDSLGLERHCAPEENDEWHQVPEQMDEIGLKQMADRAVPLLTGAGYRVSIDTVIGGTAYRAALTAASQKPPTPLPPGPPAAQDQRMRRSP